MAMQRHEVSAAIARRDNEILCAVPGDRDNHRGEHATVDLDAQQSRLDVEVKSITASACPDYGGMRSRTR